MNCVNIVSIFFYIHYTTCQYVSINSKQPTSHCESSTKNSLIEHFFNIIFTEFHTTPPVCVCVQMCAGQSTYCYPNGCLKRDDLKRVDSPQAAMQARGDRKQYMFIVDEKNDVMKDFFENSYMDDSKRVSSPIEETIQHMRPETFKEKYNMIYNYKKMPSVQVRYNLREQVKNMKSDFLKLENVGITKTRWPMNKRNIVTGHKVHSMIEKRAPLVGKTNIFMSMVPVSNVGEYPAKYFKRDITKSLTDEDTNAGYYLFGNPDNTTTEYHMNETISLETLIENLINNSFESKSNVKKNGTHLNDIAKKYIMTNKTEAVKEETTFSPNATVNESMSPNLINQQDNTNKFIDDSVTPSTNKLNKLIISLSNRIEKQNNTSMQMAKRIVGDFDEENSTLTTSKAYKIQLNSSFTENLVETDDTETANQETTTVTPADFIETMVTKKNRQRRARKLQNSKNNTQ